MNILVIAATAFELDPFFDFLEKECEKKNFFSYIWKNHTISTMITGVGQVNMAFALSRYNAIKETDYVLNVGIAGSYSQMYPPTTMVEVVSERFADLGVEDNDGSFIDVFELELIDKNVFPYMNGAILNEKRKYETKFPKVNSITVNKVHGAAHSIEAIRKKYNPDIETMEGASFFFASKMMDLKFTQLRAISNYVEPRNRANWKINEAIDVLNVELIEHLKDVMK